MIKPSLLVCGHFAEMISTGPWCWMTTSQAPDKANKYNKQARVGETGQSTKQVNNTEQTLRRDYDVSHGRVTVAAGGTSSEKLWRKFQSCSPVCFSDGRYEPPLPPAVCNVRNEALNVFFLKSHWVTPHAGDSPPHPCRSRLTNLCGAKDSQPCDTSAALLGWIALDTPPLCSASTRKPADSTQSTGGLWFCSDWQRCWKPKCGCCVHWGAAAGWRPPTGPGPAVTAVLPRPHSHYVDVQKVTRMGLFSQTANLKVNTDGCHETFSRVFLRLDDLSARLSSPKQTSIHPQAFYMIEWVHHLWSDVKGQRAKWVEVRPSHDRTLATMANKCQNVRRWETPLIDQLQHHSDKLVFHM